MPTLLMTFYSENVTCHSSPRISLRGRLVIWAIPESAQGLFLVLGSGIIPSGPHVVSGTEQVSATRAYLLTISPISNTTLNSYHHFVRSVLYVASP